jgi:DNA polymerase/3'-5' exonuclease PolX
LPGCGNKIAELYQHWHSTGQMQEVKISEADPKVAVVKQFYNIWGVGDTTAREFYQKGSALTTPE